PVPAAPALALLREAWIELRHPPDLHVGHSRPGGDRDRDARKGEPSLGIEGAVDGVDHYTDGAVLGARNSPQLDLPALLGPRDHRDVQPLDRPEHRVLGCTIDHIRRVAALAAPRLDGPLRGGAVGL